jgi:hypothetical protein
MDSPAFCGQVCHTVMQPEFVAHQAGAHSKVACAECHIGSGASWFVKAKVNGTRQVISVLGNSYARPIPTPVHNLRPALETCGECHTPGRFHGEKAVVVPEFQSDEHNTSSVTRLLMHIGGGSPALGMGGGIHWHANSDVEIDYVAADDERQTIPYVRVKDADGSVREFKTSKVTDAGIAGRERRRMDCVDCHNRPTHRFFATAERGVDAALLSGAIPASLPFARRETVAALKAEYPDRETAQRNIDARLREFYASHGSDGMTIDPRAVDRLVRGAQALYERNVFPDMKVTWGTHPSQLGHTDAPGCFRCHDDQHKSADGRVIKQDCELCHQMQ